MLPDANPSQRLLFERKQPAFVSPVGMKAAGVAMALVANPWPLTNTSVGALMSEEHIRSKCQAVPEAWKETHRTLPVPGNHTGIPDLCVRNFAEKKGGFSVKGS